jgi:hypothetical protein
LAGVSLSAIVAEGAAPDAAGRSVPDRRLYQVLHPGFDRVTLISGGGKRECIALARALSPALAEFSKLLKVTALVDKESARQAAHTAVDGIRGRQRRREEFDGKKLLADFCGTHLGTTTLSRHVFAFYAARRARRRRSVVGCFDEFFAEPGR